MKKGRIVKRTKSHNLPQLENNLFLITAEASEKIMLEDGSISVENILFGYPVFALPTGNLIVHSTVKTSLLKSSFEFEKVVDCYYINTPQIVSLIEENKE